jgi:hypothetical protein
LEIISQTRSISRNRKKICSGGYTNVNRVIRFPFPKKTKPRGIVRFSVFFPQKNRPFAGIGKVPVENRKSPLAGFLFSAPAGPFPSPPRFAGSPFRAFPATLSTGVPSPVGGFLSLFRISALFHPEKAIEDLPQIA